MIFKHSIECEQLMANWDRFHPHRCKTCNGAGGTQYPATFWEPPDFTECDDCVGQGKCPLCGQLFDGEDYNWDDTLPCGHKLWNPEAPYCICDAPVCPVCRHLMHYNRTEKRSDDSAYSHYDWEVEIYKCTFCGTEIEGG